MRRLDHLSFCYHSDLLARAGIKLTDETKDLYFDAQNTHALSVNSELIDFIQQIISVSRSRPDRKFEENLVFGVARRSKFIWVSLRRIIEISPPHRSAPMRHDDVWTLAADLNALYINLRGAMDNMAWALIALSESEEAKNIQPQHVGLFSRNFQNIPEMARIRPILVAAASWAADVKERRDPAAHRIPLSVPPTILSPDDVIKQVRLTDDYNEKLRIAAADQEDNENLIKRLNDAGKVLDEMQELGRYIPVFCHSPDAGIMPIYPTVPEDVGNFIRTIKQILSVIDEI